MSNLIPCARQIFSDGEKKSKLVIIIKKKQYLEERHGIAKSHFLLGIALVLLHTDLDEW